MSTDKLLNYRGDVKAAVGVGGTVVFVTVHPEGQPTAVYRLGAANLSLASDPLPCGGACLVADADTVWVGGTDAKVYQLPARGGAPAALAGPFAAPPAGLALLSNNRLGVLAGGELLVVSRKDGKVLQSLPLPDAGTVVAADPTGHWVATGTAKGQVVVFESEDRPTFEPSATEKLHDGAVTALLFEADDLRFFSAGADQKLLTTHARGRLEPEDKARGAGHAEPIAGMVWGPADRFFTGSKDKSIKSWPRTGNMRPTTQKEGLVKVVALALVQLHKRSQLAALCEDNTVRLFAVDDEGKVGDLESKVSDAYARARSELNRDETPRRDAALRELAAYNDSTSIELISEQIGKDADHGLRVLATQLLGGASNPKAARLLEKALAHAEDAVRVAAFEGLRRQLGEDDLKPLDLALKVDRADVGKLAVAALEKLANRDDQALNRLTDALNVKTWEVRQAALAGLERVYEPDTAEANLLALSSTHADLRRLTLIRLFQRQMLGHARVQSVLRWRGEDKDAEVRRTAYLLTLYTRPNLVQTLRSRDPELDRQLTELETFGREPGAPEPEAAPRPSDPERERLLALPVARLELTEPTAAALAAAKIVTVRDLVARTESGLRLGDAGLQEVKHRLAQRGLRLGEAARPASAAKPAAARLAEDDLHPLLQATASRALDTCIRGARGLAVLHDPRAFGLLLQLSREDDAPARVEVCRAMAALEDARSIKRLRSLLFDKEATVRDAAFSALAHLYTAEPLSAAEAGLTAAFEDVRRRGLQVLLTEVKKAPPSGEAEPSWQLLVRALNDSFPAVRAEAFKASLNLKVAGGGGDTLRFVLQSIHADVRREVLTEVMAQVNEPWAWALLLMFLNDPDPKLREEAFAFAVKRSKELEPLEAGLTSRYLDIRRAAVQALVKKHSKASQEMLARALADREKEIRQLALESLVDDDARAALDVALRSDYPDVRVRAGKALARHGAAIALGPLLSLVTTPEPQEKEKQADWQVLVEGALDALAELGDPMALPAVWPHLESKQPSVRALAARAAVWCARGDTLESLRGALQHSDATVKFQAARGLALNGDPLAATLVFSDAGKTSLSAQERLIAALALGPAGEDQLIVFLDDVDEAIRQKALLLLLFLEWKSRRPVPARLLACLSSQAARVRLTAARALEAYSDPAAFAAFVVGQFNDRGDEQPWKVPAETVDALAELVVHGAPDTRARSAALLRFLSEKEQSAFDQNWSVHRRRFAAEVERLQTNARARSAPTPQYDAAQLLQLAFGAYVGLVREQGGAHTSQQRGAPGPQVARVRQSALSRVFALAQADPAYARAARPVLIQALGDPHQPVRLQAFEHLQALGLDSATLGAEAIETGHTDLGVKGLEVLTGSASAAEGAAVLEQVMLTRKDALAEESAKLLIARRNVVAVASKALAAAHEPLRDRAVQWLAAQYDADPAAKEHLRQALQSRYQRVRETAAFELATKKDAAAFDALVKLLAATQDKNRQSAIVRSLVTLGDRRTPTALLDRLENDPTASANTDELINRAAGFRDPASADRLLSLAERHLKWRKTLLKAVETVSGYDQEIREDEEDRPPPQARPRQHPRHDAILARLMDRCLALGETRQLAGLLKGACWARGKEVEPALVTLTTHSEDKLRHYAVEALGWRLRRRSGPAEPLLKALGHRDPATQFLAAEGLAKAGRGEGFSVLLTGLEFLEDTGNRKRAALALGVLADARALDVLLKLAGDEAHELHEAAAEAIGHMGRSGRGEQIFRLLERTAKGSNRNAASALRGLRWFNTPDAWAVIRERAAGANLPHRDTALEMLGHNDEPPTRELLLKLLSTDANFHLLSNKALPAARRLWGEESLEPDYALLKNPAVPSHARDSLTRVCDRGVPKRIFEVLPSCNAAFKQDLIRAVITRPTLPVAEAAEAIVGNDERTVQLAAQVLGRAGPEASRHAPAVEKALERWRTSWIERRQRMILSGNNDQGLRDLVTPCVQVLLWAVGRLGVGGKALVATLNDRPDDLLYRPLRREAAASLTAGALTPEALAALETAAQGDDPELRVLAAEAVGRADPRRGTALAGKVLSDRASFNNLVRQPGVSAEGTLKDAVRQVHYQGVALPHLVRSADLDSLAKVVADRALPEAARLGAVEAIALTGSEKAEGLLLSIGKAEGEDEDVRKAAWRGIKRLRRDRKAAREVKA